MKTAPPSEFVAEHSMNLHLFIVVFSVNNAPPIKEVATHFLNVHDSYVPFPPTAPPLLALFAVNVEPFTVIE